METENPRLGGPIGSTLGKKLMSNGSMAEVCVENRALAATQAREQLESSSLKTTCSELIQGSQFSTLNDFLSPARPLLLKVPRPH